MGKGKEVAANVFRKGGTCKVVGISKPTIAFENSRIEERKKKGSLLHLKLKEMLSEKEEAVSIRGGSLERERRGKWLGLVRPQLLSKTAEKRKGKGKVHCCI